MRIFSGMFLQTCMKMTSYKNTSVSNCGTSFPAHPEEYD